MQLISRWFQKDSVQPSRLQGPATSQPQREDTRRELLGIALRDTLRKHGIPPHWITLETHAAITANRIRGMHLRLVVREWQPRFLAYTVALQKAVLARLIRLDPLAPSWMAGISWKFDVVDNGQCPALPPASHWQGLHGVEATPLVPRALLEGLMGSALGARYGVPADARSDFRPTEPMAER
jgi:hypothetical protein